MGRQHMLKPQLLLPIIVLIMVMVGLGAAFYFVSLPQQRATGLLFNEPDNLSIPTSDAGGSIEVVTVVKNANGEIVRQITPSDYYGYQIVDPTTNKDVKFYAIQLGYECWGKNVDWSTFDLSGTWTYQKYIGVDNAGGALQKSYNQQLGTVKEINPEVAIEIDANEEPTGKETVNGTVAFADIDITTLMPDSIMILTHDYDDEGHKIPVTTYHNQKTSWTHAVKFFFTCDFSVTIKDDYGNPYNSPYGLDLEIKLIWAGSDFNMQWGASQSGSPSAEGSAPDPTEAAPAPAADNDVEPIPKEDYFMPTIDLKSSESMYLTNDRAGDVFAANLTGAQGSLLITIGLTMFIVPVAFFMWLRKK